MKEETTGKAQEMMDLFAPIVRYGYNRAIIEIGEYLAEIDKLDTGDIYALLSKKLEEKQTVTNKQIGEWLKNEGK